MISGWLIIVLGTSGTVLAVSEVLPTYTDGGYLTGQARLMYADCEDAIGVSILLAQHERN